MPTYLCHGFRWHRKSIRYFVAKYDIEDGATEWVIAPQSEAALIEHFYNLYSFLPPAAPVASVNAPSSLPYRRHNHAPSKDSGISHTDGSEHNGSENKSRSNGSSATTRSRSASRPGSDSPSQPITCGQDETTHANPSPSIPQQKSNNLDTSRAIKLLEEFDPADESRVSGPWAYVADYIVRVDTSVSIADEMFRYETRAKRDSNRAMNGPSDEYGRSVFGASAKKAGWLEKLRDQLQRGESIRWYVVVCGDEERANAAGNDDNDEEVELLEEDEVATEEEECEGGSERSRRLRQSQSTQSTEATTTTNPSVIEGGFEYRIPELAGLAVRMPTIAPKRKQNKQPLAPPARKDNAMIPSPAPPKPPPPSDPVSSEHGGEASMHPKSARSTAGLRKLFSRRKSADKPLNE